MLDVNWNYVDTTQTTAQDAIDAAYRAWLDAVETGLDVTDSIGETQEIDNKRSAIVQANKDLRDAIVTNNIASGSAINADIFAECNALDEAFRLASAETLAPGVKRQDYLFASPLVYSIRAAVEKCCMKAKFGANH